VWSNEFHRHLADVEVLAQHGVAAPPQWLKLRERFTAFTELPSAAAEALAREVIDPTGADLATLRALALSEQSAGSTDDAAVSDVVRNRVHGTMVEIYRPVADKNYRAVAKRFDAAAAAFTKAAELADPRPTLARWLRPLSRSVTLG
jgi:hypothetical protein